MVAPQLTIKRSTCEAFDGHDAGDDRNIDARAPGSLHELEIVLIIEEKLGDHEIQAGVHFALEIHEVYGGIAAFGVLFGIARPTQAQRRIMPVPDKLHQLAGIPEPALHGFELRLPLWRIAAQGQNIFDTGIDDSPQNAAQVIARRADASEVRHGLDARLALHAGDDFDGSLARGTSGAVCD